MPHRPPLCPLLLLVLIVLCVVALVTSTDSTTVDERDAISNSLTVDASYLLEDPKCFETTQELRNAVQQYHTANDFDADLASKYGWPIGQWCVSNIQDFSNLFRAKHHRYFDEPLEDWDMASAKDLSGLFQNCRFFNQPLNRWDVSAVTTMSRMFAGAPSFQQPLDEWDTGNCRDMSYMFLHAFSFQESESLNAWNIDKVTDMEGMFRDTRNFDHTKLKWDVSHVKNTAHMISEIPGVSLNLRGGDYNNNINNNKHIHRQ